MKNFCIYILKIYFYIALSATAVLLFSRCKFDESLIKIERFEYLEEALDREAYLVHGYKKRFDEEINKVVDKYVCDSLYPYLEFKDMKILYFFRQSKNTDRQNFQADRKHKIIYAWSNDILFSYSFHNFNGSIVPTTKYYRAIGGKEDPPPESFRCD